MINLKDRPDRLKSVSERLKSYGLNFEIIEAVAGSKLPVGTHSCPPNVAACWLSHQFAASKFLESKDEHALILEDDAKFVDDAMRFIKNPGLFIEAHLDIFQLGYNVQNNKVASGHRDSRLRRRSRIICNLHKIGNLVHFEFLKKCPSHEFEVSLKSVDPFVLNLFETGTHGYVISRNAARIIMEFNNPVLLPADIALCEISQCKDISMARPTTSLITQDDSVSSIPEISNEALESKLTEIMKGFPNACNS